MSLVERALKKLQESRAVTGPESLQPAVAVPDASPALAPAPEPVRIEPPQRIVSIDKEALRALQLLPPQPFERQLASQYQHVKRPLVESALGKGERRIANGNLIMLTSALPGEGKTFTSINLALSMALERDIDVLLVDADVAKPNVSRVLDVEGERGLLDLLGDGDLHPDAVILRTNVRGLSLLPAGKRIETATELLASERMHEVARQLGGRGGRRVVLFDSPPLLLSTESRALIGSVGQVVLVVRSEVTPQSAVMEAIEAVGDAKPVSLILNQSSSAAGSGYYGYGSYGDTQASSAAQ